MLSVQAVDDGSLPRDADEGPVLHAPGGYVGVPLLRWPLERRRADELAACGFPFLLLVAEGEDPPILAYPLCDWVRSPIDAEELVVRRSTVENRYLHCSSGVRPDLDETGRLRFGPAAVDLAPSQVAAVRLLIERYREIVENDRLRLAFGLAADAPAEALKSRIGRLRRRLHAVGLDVRRANRVGFALEPANVS